MADLIFDDIDEVEGDDDGIYLESLFETGMSYDEGEKVELSVKGRRKWRERGGS